MRHEKPDMQRSSKRPGAGRPRKMPQECVKGTQGRIQAHRPYPTSRYKVLGGFSEAENVVAWAKARGMTVFVADGFSKTPRPQCLWLYNRPDSRPDGRTITVYGETTAAGLVYLREDGTFQ